MVRNSLHNPIHYSGDLDGCAVTKITGICTRCGKDVEVTEIKVLAQGDTLFTFICGHHIQAVTKHPIVF